MLQIDSYLSNIANAYSDLVTFDSIGRSFEGRNIPLIKISTNPSANKPVIFIDAGIHAREWIAHSQALYIISQLVTNSTNRYLLDKVDWQIVPVLNPDGYEYTHTAVSFLLLCKVCIEIFINPP